MASHFVPIQLSESGRPALLPNEIELLLQASVEIFDNWAETRFRNGVLRLTTYRLLWINADRPTDAVGLSLQLIEALDRTSKFFGKPRIGLTLVGERGIVRLGFRAGGRDTVYAKLEETIRKRSWEVRE